MCLANQNAPFISTKEPYICTKEPDISTKEPYISTKEPYISTKEPYISTKCALHLHKRALHLRKRNLQKGSSSPGRLQRCKFTCVAPNISVINQNAPFVSATQRYPSAKET